MFNFSEARREARLNPVAAEVRGIIFDGSLKTVKEQAADAAWEWGGIDRHFDIKVANCARVGIRGGNLDREEVRIFGQIVTKGSICARGLFWVAFERALEKFEI